MCLRVAGCCNISLRTWAIIVGVFTILETIMLIVGGGMFLHEGLKANDRGGPTGYIREPHRISMDKAFGALYLAFGALWVVCCIAYVAAIFVERALYLLPWLVLQAITMGLGLANMISNAAALKQYWWFSLIVFEMLFLFFYMMVFSYYLELQEQKRTQNRFGAQNY